MTIYVANLNYHMQETDLNRLFAVYGRVEQTNIIKDRTTRKHKGFGFVQMPDSSDGKRAIAALHGAVIGGRTLVVSIANDRKELQLTPLLKEHSIIAE